MSMNSDYTQHKKEPLLKQILEFQRIKNWLIIPLIILGVFSLMIPVMPGLLFIFAGIMIWKPGVADKIKDKISSIYESVVGCENK